MTISFPSREQRAQLRRVLDKLQIAGITSTSVTLTDAEATLVERAFWNGGPALLVEGEMCVFCKVKPVAYEGAIYCGAACAAKAESKEKKK